MTRLQRIATAVFTVAAMLAGSGAAQAEPALWKVTHGQATAYLFGSVHLLKPDAVWNTPRVEAALAESKELWLEIKEVDDAASMRPLVAKLGMDPAHPLSSQLDATYQEKLKKALKNIGYPETALESLRPWLAALTLNLAPLQRGGYDAEAGVDRLLKAAAKARGLDIEAFETSEAQLHYLADLPQDLQLEMVREALDEFDTAIAQLNRLEAAWERGDEQEIDRLMREDMPPILYQRLIKERNQRFAKGLIARMHKPGVIFVAVGAGHLAGPDSVQAELTRAGYVVQRQ
jgi:uncharacterized protein YbaP (TraB family)